MRGLVVLVLNTQALEFADYTHICLPQPKKPGASYLSSQAKLQLSEILSAVHNHSTTLHLALPQDLFIRDSEFSRIQSSPLLRQFHVGNHEHAQIDLVETDVGLLVVDTCHVG